MRVNNHGTLIANIGKIYEAKSEKAPLVLFVIQDRKLWNAEKQVEEEQESLRINIKFWYRHKKRLEGLISKGWIGVGDQLIISYELRPGKDKDDNYIIEFHAIDFETGKRSGKNANGNSTTKPKTVVTYDEEDPYNWDQFLASKPTSQPSSQSSNPFDDDEDIF